MRQNAPCETRASEDSEGQPSQAAYFNLKYFKHLFKLELQLIKP